MNNFKSTFKTSFITGGSQLAVMIFNLVRAKFLAIFLGPGGTGLIGLYSTATQLVSMISSMGLSNSAVKQISKSNNNNKGNAEIGEILYVFRILILITSFLGFLFLLLFAKQICIWTFGNANNINGLRWMSIVVLLTGISSGQSALLQGLRKIKELAIAKIIGTALGTIISIIILYIYRDEGIVLFLISGSFLTLILTWWFSKQVEIKEHKVDFILFKSHSKKLFQMGFAFLISGLATSFTAYYTRVLISKQFSVHDLGLYTASWTLSAMYIQFILSAMGMDFYPKLVGIIHDKKKSVELINDQIAVGLVMSIMGILSIIVFSKYILKIFYSNEFIDAYTLLRWMTLGMIIKVITWPLGFIIVAKSKSMLFVFTETLWSIMYLLFLYFGIKIFGLKGAGIAFFFTYLIHGIIIWVISIELLNYKWSKQVLVSVSILSIVVCLVLLIDYFFQGWKGMVINTVILISVLLWNYNSIQKMLNISIFDFVTKKLGLKK